MKNKRNLFFILSTIFIVLLSSLIIANASDKKSYVLGDVDKDGEITATDYLRIKKAFLKEYTLEGTAFALADVDFNNEINSTDYLKIKKSMISDEAIDFSEWEKFEGKKEIEYCSSPSVFSYDYYAKMLGYNDVYLTPDTTGETSAESNVSDIFEYDAYTGLFVVAESPFDHPETITEVFENGQTVTLNYNSFSLFPTGEYQHSYYFYQKATDELPSALYYVYTDKNDNIVGKRYVQFEKPETDKESLSEKEIIELANAKKDELGFSDFTLSSVESGNRYFTIYFERKINGLSTPDYLFLKYENYGVLTEYNSYVGNSAEYDLRGFDSVSNKEKYYSVIKARGDYLLKNFVCECQSSKNPNDYIFSFEITEYFISYDGKMCAKAHVVYDSIDETQSHDHTFTVYIYISSEEYSENEAYSEDESIYESDTASTENVSSNDESVERYSIYLDNQKIDTDCIVYSYNGENVYNGETKIGIPFLSILNAFGAKTEWIHDFEVEITINENEKDIINISEDSFGIPVAPGSRYGIREAIDGEIFMDPSTVGICLYGYFDLEYTPSVKINSEKKSVLVITSR